MPAWPATPPRWLATSSWTTPRSSPRDERASVATSRLAFARPDSQLFGLKPVSRRPSGSVEVALERLVEPLAGDLLDDLAGDHEPDAGIAERVAGHGAGDQRRGEHGVPAGRVVGQAGDLGADGQAAGVGEQHLDGDPLLARAGEGGQVVADRRGQVDTSLVDLLQQQDGRVHLRDRGEVEDGVGTHRDALARREQLRARPVAQRLPDRGVHSRLPVHQDDSDSTGETLVLDGLRCRGQVPPEQRGHVLRVAGLPAGGRRRSATRWRSGARRRRGVLPPRRNPTRLPAASVPVTASPGPAAPGFGAPLSPQPVRAEVAAARPAPSRVRRATGMPEIVTVGTDARQPDRSERRSRPSHRSTSGHLPDTAGRHSGGCATIGGRHAERPSTGLSAHGRGRARRRAHPRYPLGEHDVPLPFPGLRRAECGSTP